MTPLISSSVERLKSPGMVFFNAAAASEYSSCRWRSPGNSVIACRKAPIKASPTPTGSTTSVISMMGALSSSPSVHNRAVSVWWFEATILRIPINQCLQRGNWACSSSNHSPYSSICISKFESVAVNGGCLCSEIHSNSMASPNIMSQRDNIRCNV